MTTNSTNSAKKILLIDDEYAIAETISAYAEKEGFEIIHVDDGEKGVEMFNKIHPDMVILDWMLPGMSGPEAIKYLRETSDVPILMISARNDEGDIVIALELGADDYITKPFGPRELIARIHNLFRRIAKTDDKEDLVVGNLLISFERMEVSKKGKSVSLTPNEFRILELLFENKNKVVSRQTLMETALGYDDFLNDRTIDTHIKNIRKKLEENPKKPKLIQTVRETGFKLVIPLLSEHK
ncbi:MAG: response regulator transcription factor [Patescibacteria group bacterium]